MFYVGQKVVALRTYKVNIGIGITKDNTYTVHGFDKCQGCGLKSLDIGLRGSKSDYPYKSCDKCGYGEQSDGICQMDEVFFAPLQDDDAEAEEKVKELLQEVFIYESILHNPRIC